MNVVMKCRIWLNPTFEHDILIQACSWFYDCSVGCVTHKHCEPHEDGLPRVFDEVSCTFKSWHQTKQRAPNTDDVLKTLQTLQSSFTIMTRFLFLNKYTSRYLSGAA